MNQKRNLILIATILALCGTIYAFSGFHGMHSCKNLLSFGLDCSMCDFDYISSNFDSNTFIYNSDSSKNFAKNNYIPISNLKDRDVSFFRVPLVCSAAPSIGCGSRSKPVLNSLEESSEVDEAWLNRSGTIIAIVWNEGIDVTAKNEIVNIVFKEHKINVEEIKSKEYIGISESFGKGEDWLKGSSVDDLSKEEASIFANRITKTIKENTDLSEANLNKIEQKIKDDFYSFFLNYSSMDDLGNPNSYKTILKDAISYGNDLAGKEVMPSLETLWSSCTNISNSPSCCKTGKECSSSCKVKT